MWSISHLAYHVATADQLSTAGNLANLTLLGLSVAVPRCLLPLVSGATCAGGRTGLRRSTAGKA